MDPVVYYSITVLQYYSITVLQYYSITVLQYYSITNKHDNSYITISAYHYAHRNTQIVFITNDC